MSNNFKTYNKAQLLEFLNKECPEAMAKLPDPKWFTFRAAERGRDYVTIRSTWSRDVPRDPENLLWPWSSYDLQLYEEIYKVHYMAESSTVPRDQRFGVRVTRDDSLLQPSNSPKMNKEVEHQWAYVGSIQESVDQAPSIDKNIIEIARNNNFSAFVKEYKIDNMNKAFFAFKLVYCDLATELKEHQEKIHRAKDLRWLVAALKVYTCDKPYPGIIPPFMPPWTAEGDVSDNSQEPASVKKPLDKKRPHDEDDKEEPLQKKKARSS